MADRGPPPAPEMSSPRPAGGIRSEGPSHGESMGLDAHVMPISAYVVGDYDSPMLEFAEQMGIPATVFGPDGVRKIGPPRGWRGSLLRWSGIYQARKAYERWRRGRLRRQGHEYVAWLRGEIEALLGPCPGWNEEGPATRSHQLFRGSLHALRAYAYQAEFPEAFADLAGIRDEDGNELEGTDAIYQRRHELGLSSDRFPHLCTFSDIDGYYLPFAFAAPIRIHDPLKEDHPWWGDNPEMQKRDVGSSECLARELDELNQTLRITCRWDSAEKSAAAGSDDFFLENAKTGWMLMEWFARGSLETDTPICFDG